MVVVVVGGGSLAVGALFSFFLFFLSWRAVIAKDAANLRQSHDFTGSQNDPRGSLGGERGRDGVSSVQERGGEREGERLWMLVGLSKCKIRKMTGQERGLGLERFDAS